MERKAGFEKKTKNQRVFTLEVLGDKKKDFLVAQKVPVPFILPFS